MVTTHQLQIHPSMVHMDLLSSSSKATHVLWNLSNIEPGYDPVVKGFVYRLFSSKVRLFKIFLYMHIKKSISFPRNGPLVDRNGLTWPGTYVTDLSVVLMQVFVDDRHGFSFELCVIQGKGVANPTSSRLRLLFSTSFSQLKSSGLHVQIPMLNLPRNVWLNLFCDANDFVTEPNFRVQSLVSMQLNGKCSLRRVVLMRATTPAILPPHLDFLPATKHEYFKINVFKKEVVKEIQPNKPPSRSLQRRRYIPVLKPSSGSQPTVKFEELHQHVDSPNVDDTGHTEMSLDESVKLSDTLSGDLQEEIFSSKEESVRSDTPIETYPSSENEQDDHDALNSEEEGSTPVKIDNLSIFVSPVAGIAETVVPEIQSSTVTDIERMFEHLCTLYAPDSTS